MSMLRPLSRWLARDREWRQKVQDGRRFRERQERERLDASEPIEGKDCAD